MAPPCQPDTGFEPAPAGTRVRLLSLLVPVILVVAISAAAAGGLAVPRGDPVARWLPLLLPLVLLPALLVYWHGARVRGYRLTGEELRVERAFQTVRFPLAGLVDVTFDREALRGARRILGNDGFGAVAGRFRSKRLGRFRVYLTDVEHAVVLRWPDRGLVISPQHHSLFVDTVRRRAGLPP
jgi:Bacterial PH domain